MTVLDTSAVVDFLLGVGAAEEVSDLLADAAPPAAPDIVIFEVLAVLRREAARGVLDAERAARAVDDLHDLGLELFPSLDLRSRAWQLRENLTIADGLFVALTELLGEPLATKDMPLARTARALTSIEIVVLGAS